MIVEERGIGFRTGVRLPSGPVQRKARKSALILIYSHFTAFPDVLFYEDNCNKISISLRNVDDDISASVPIDRISSEMYNYIKGDIPIIFHDGSAAMSIDNTLYLVGGTAENPLVNSIIYANYGDGSVVKGAYFDDMNIRQTARIVFKSREKV